MKHSCQEDSYASISVSTFFGLGITFDIFSSMEIPIVSKTFNMSKAVIDFDMEKTI